MEPIYNGVGDRVGQTVGATTTHFALDLQGLPEVIQTSEGNSYLHLPGVIVAESAAGEVRYLLSDGLGSVRQVVDDTAQVVGYNEYDPYGNVMQWSAVGGQSSYGYTGEWWQDEVGLLHLRARWYLAETGTFLSRDMWEGDELQPLTLNEWSYVEENPINRIDPSGFISQCKSSNCKVELMTVPVRNIPFLGHYGIVHTDQNNKQRFVDALPEDTSVDWLSVILSGDVENLGNPAYWNPRPSFQKFLG